jgi:hypothetical protein
VQCDTGCQHGVGGASGLVDQPAVCLLDEVMRSWIGTMVRDPLAATLAADCFKTKALCT